MKFFDNIFKRQNSQNLTISQNLAHNSQNLRIFRNIPYANFIFAGFALSAIYALIYALMRVCLIFHTFGDDVDFSKFGKAFKMGFVLDMRIVCVVFAVFILLGLLALANKFALAKFTNGGGDYLYKIALYFGALASFLIILSAFINFYYFQTYHTKIDIFIFGLKDDDTKAILEILWADYPVLWVLLWSAIFSICCFKIAKFILLWKGAESSADSANRASIFC